jgi:transposase
MKNKKRKELDKIHFKSAIINKTTIFGILQREGSVHTQIISGPTKENVEPIIAAKVDTSSIVYTDTSYLYNHLKNKYSHDSVNHTFREWAKGNCHINTIESFWNLVKRTIKGTHIHVSDRHLQKYLDEIEFRWVNRDKQDTMFETILSHVV